jgi:hypothetical protein
MFDLIPQMPWLQKKGEHLILLLQLIIMVRVKRKKSPHEAMADAIIGYIKVKEAEVVNPRNMTEALGVELQSFMRSQSAKEKIDLLEKQISVVARRLEQS